MLLPNEALLDVLGFVDFSTLVSAKYVAARFLGVVNANEHLLAIQRRFQINVHGPYITYDDVLKGARRKSIRFDPAKLASFAAACRQLADVIGQHAVGKLALFENISVMPGVDVLFEIIPACKFAEDVSFDIRKCAHAGRTAEVLMEHFAWLKSLHLCVDYDVFRQFRWSFLRPGATRGLRMITARLPNRWTVHHREIDVTVSIRRMIKVLEESDREINIKVATSGNAVFRINLEDNDHFKAVKTGANGTLFSSRSSGVTVNADEYCIAISTQPTDGVSGK